MTITGRRCASMCHSLRYLVVSVLPLVGAFTGCDEDGAGNPAGGGSEPSPLGANCTSSSGLSGTIVESQSKCYLDDAFCEERSDGHYCTGGRPFVCPTGQIRTGWTSCGFPSGGSSSAGASSTGAAERLIYQLAVLLEEAAANPLRALGSVPGVVRLDAQLWLVHAPGRQNSSDRLNDVAREYSI